MSTYDLADRLTPGLLCLAGLLADTDLPPQGIAAEFGMTVRALAPYKALVYRAYRVHSRAGLRAAMLALELAPAGAR
jgi:hypothetical protein